MSKKATWDDINQTAREWFEVPTEGNEARKMALQNEVFGGLLPLLKEKELEAVGAFFERDWERFDPSKQEFQKYFYSRIELRSIDIYHENMDRAPVEVIDDTARDVSEKKVKRKRIRHDSMNRMVEGKDDSAIEYGEHFEDTQIQSAMEGLELDLKAYECMAMILNLPNLLNGRANNPERINYFRLFFTDGVSDYLRAEGIRSFKCHERDLFQAMKETLLDFVFVDQCRTVEEIVDSAIKKYGELVEERPMEPVKQPLPNDVYTTYLYEVEAVKSKDGGKVGESTISNQKTSYRDFMKQGLLNG